MILLAIEKILTLPNVIILLKSVLNKDKNHHYYRIFLEKCSYQLAKKYSQFFFHSTIMVRFGEKNRKKKVLCCKKAYTNLEC